MLAIVCKTFEGVKALEKYDGEGLVNSRSGLHLLGSSIGSRINGRFRVICLEDLRQEYPTLALFFFFFFCKVIICYVKILTIVFSQTICWWVCS